ncbi:NXPE family member 3-like isoform X2 [Myxocyprinus asiaticus]|uniref:NXPE family member 3-like isoform X2 n=1 Tax=Myxocyprinus asiaticus TaxID=70543 RepID=UPI00222377AD|nr:NXPE family member 3-like isoform X2 [Myxocyprinus asiaticus]
MERLLPKYFPFFTLLALIGLIFLLWNITSLEHWTCQTVSTFYQLQNSIQSALKTSELLLPEKFNYSYCVHLGQKPSTEETREESNLLKSIAWPEPLVLGLPLRQSSDPAQSYYIIQNSGELQVGGQLVVKVQMQNFIGQPKKHGGDFLVARLHTPELGAGVTGQVHDHRDGNYTVFFPLLWAGVVQVELTMVHSSEAVMVLRRLREEQSDRVFFKSLFRSGYLTETTVCNLCLPVNQQPLCNYTDPQTGEPWYCYKPKMLGCDTRINHSKGGYKKHLLTVYESQFFQSGINIKIPIHAAGMENVIVQPASKEFKEFNFHSLKNVGPHMAADSSNNILLRYRCHGPPIRFTYVYAAELHYISNELDALRGGSDTVVLISIWSHFSTFPVQVFIRRLRHIRRAVIRLLNREPATLVLLRTANLQKLDPETSLYNSDWFSQQLDMVLRAMFKGLNVQLVDAWEMTLAHHHPHQLHPPPAIISNMIHFILSHICPVRRKRRRS